MFVEARRGWLVVLIAALAGSCLGQNTNSGDIRGTVTDASGAVVPGVGVTLLPKELYEKGWQHGSTHAHAIPEFSRPVDTLFIRRRESQQQSALNAFLEKSRAASNLQHIA